MEIGLQAEEANDSDRRCSPATAEETDDSDCRCGPTATGPGLRVHSVQTVSTKLNLALTSSLGLQQKGLALGSRTVGSRIVGSRIVCIDEHVYWIVILPDSESSLIRNFASASYHCYTVQ